MPPYPVPCSTRGCPAPAAYKIAARWSDGSTHELKTYSLACDRCAEVLLAEANVKRAACRLAQGETLDEPGVYELHRGGRDTTLVRRKDVEARLTRPGPAPPPRAG
jgi:hypothetical protein